MAIGGLTLLSALTTVIIFVLLLASIGLLRQGRRLAPCRIEPSHIEQPRDLALKGRETNRRSGESPRAPG